MSDRHNRPWPEGKISKYSGRCARVCALLFAILCLAASCVIPALADESDDEITQEEIDEQESRIREQKDASEGLKSNISDLNAMKEELESSKSDLETYVTQLDAKLTQIQQNIDDLNSQIDAKEDEITRTAAELVQAQNTQKQQYAAMKKRIQFIYEKGDSYDLEMLLSSESFTDMMSKANYIKAMSDYDQKKLEEFRAQAALIAETKQRLEEQKQELSDKKAEVEQDQSNMKALVADKQQQIAGVNADISDKEAAIAQYEKQLEEQNAAIAALEAQVAAAKQKLASQNARHYSGGVFTWPCPSYSYISSDFGYRVHPIYGVTKFHSGLDMAANYGAPILAAYEGAVVAASYDWSMGNYVMIDHGDGLYTVYMHASALYVQTGQEVSAGQQIAAVGSTGSSTGPHLHFSVRLNGQYVSPWSYLGG